jgi:CDP-diacylglycerol--serine O-phosphatidyltransferase
LWLVTGGEWFRSWILTLPWMIFVALLMISNVATFSWGSLRLRRSWRLFALAGVGLSVAALITEPWLTLLAISAIYLGLIPFSVAAYGRVKQRRAAQGWPEKEADPGARQRSAPGFP